MVCRRLWHRKELLWPRPALIFSRTLIDALADLRTATPIYLATLKVVEELQFTDHPTARKFDTKRTIRSAGQPTSASRRQIISVGNCPVSAVHFRTWARAVVRPLYLNERTSSGRFGRSEKCRKADVGQIALRLLLKLEGPRSTGAAPTILIASCEKWLFCTQFQLFAYEGA
jgi:hypothetical protein